MRTINYIVVHCTASSVDAKPEDIIRYWHDQLGWKGMGYHYLILRDGSIDCLTPESDIANGVAGYNQVSIHISYIGGIDKNGVPTDNRSTLQIEAMFNKIMELSNRYPSAVILGHRDLPNVHKACPCFDVRSWLKNYTPSLGDSEP